MKFADYNIQEFTDVLSTKEPVPGGGGAAALVAAIGMALGNMVGSLTVGKKTYADVEEEMQETMVLAEAIRAELLACMDADAEAFLPLAEAYSIPKDDPTRPAVMEKALRQACMAPLELMQKICAAIELLEVFAAKGSKIAISDAGVGAVCCKAALQGAALNVFINTKSMTDGIIAGALNAQAEDMLEEYTLRADIVYHSVLERIQK